MSYLKANVILSMVVPMLGRVLVDQGPFFVHYWCAMDRRKTIKVTTAMRDAGADVIDRALSSPSGVYPPCLAEDVFSAMVQAGSSDEKEGYELP